MAEDNNIPMPNFGTNTQMAYGVATHIGPSGIKMDTSKAMSILGFSSSQTFNTTPMEDLNNAFMFRMEVLMKVGCFLLHRFCCGFHRYWRCWKI